MAAHFQDTIDEHVFGAVLHKIAEQIAERYVLENYSEIVKHIRPEAIATMAVAEGGAEISRTLKQAVSEKTREVVKRETVVLQRGLLGGMKRIL